MMRCWCRSLLCVQAQRSRSTREEYWCRQDVISFHTLISNTHALWHEIQQQHTFFFFFYKRVLSARRIEQKHFQTALRNSTWQDGVVKMLLVAMWLQGPGSFLWFPHKMCAVLPHSLITDRQQRLYRYYETDLTRIITNSCNECSFAFS